MSPGGEPFRQLTPADTPFGLRTAYIEGVALETLFAAPNFFTAGKSKAASSVQVFLFNDPIPPRNLCLADVTRVQRGASAFGDRNVAPATGGVGRADWRNPLMHHLDHYGPTWCCRSKTVGRSGVKIDVRGVALCPMQLWHGAQLLSQYMQSYGALSGMSPAEDSVRSAAFNAATQGGSH